MADPDIRKRQDDDDEEVPSRLHPIAGEPVPDSAKPPALRRLAPIATSNEGESARLQPIQSTAVAEPDQSLLESPRSSLMTFRSRENARRHGEELNAPAGGPQIIPESGSSGAARVQLEQLADEKANPYGSPENHPGRLGTIAHRLARVGNIAGDILIPRQMEMIPGTDLNRAARTAEATEQLGKAENRESEESLRTAQEENLRSETAARANPQGKTADEQALAARSRILATPEGQEPDPKDVATWKAYADLENAKQVGKPSDEGKQPIGAEGVTQHGKQLETLTAGMDAQAKAKFLDAYKAGPQDTHAVATKRLEDAKAAAQLTGSERDRALQRDIAARNHADEQSHKQMEASSEVVRAVDKNGKVHLLPRGDYEAGKDQFQGSVVKMTPQALEKATDHATIINEMQGRTNALAEAAQRMNWDDKGQLNIVKQALNTVHQSYADSLIGIPITKFLADNLKQLGLEGATPETRRYIVSLLSLREAALGLPKEITGGSRVSDISANALWETLPGGSTPNTDWAMDHLRALQSTVDRLKESRVPIVPGMPDVHKDQSLYQHHYKSTKGEIFSDDGKNWVDANGNPVGK